MSRTAVVLFSGGQDSTTCLAAALKQYDAVYTVGVDYGQRHRVELECRERIRARIESILGTHSLKDDLLLDLKAFGQLSDCALTKPEAIEMNEKTHLPTTFVPGRNLIFITYAAAYAWKLGAEAIFTGVGQADYSGYPDCRENTMKALELAIDLGMETSLRIERPLMNLSKAETWNLAETIGGDALVSFIRDETHTCYEGDHTHFHDWGYGCGKCPACVLREKGWEEYVANLKGR